MPPYVPWIQRPSMPTPRFASSASMGPDGHIYVVGGYQQIGFGTVKTKDVFEFAPEANTWSIRTTLPFEIYGNTSCVMGRKLYIIGGERNGTWNAPPYVLDRLVDVYELDLDSNTLITRASVPTTDPVNRADMAYPCACALDDNVYLITFDTGFLSITAWVWNQGTNTWSRIADSGISVGIPQGVAAIDGEIYIATMGDKDRSRILRLNPPTFTTLSLIPISDDPVFTGQYGYEYNQGGLPSKGSKLYPNGSFTGLPPSANGVSNIIWEYDIITNVFTTIPGRSNVYGIADQPEFAAGDSLVGCLGNSLFSMGGLHNTPSTSGIVYQPINGDPIPSRLIEPPYNSGNLWELDLSVISPVEPPIPSGDTGDSWYVGNNGVWRRGSPYVGPAGRHGRTYIGHGGVWTPANRID